MNQVLFNFIASALLPLTLSIFTFFVSSMINECFKQNRLKQLVTMAIKSIEQTLPTEDGHTKFQAVKDFVLTRNDVEEEILDCLIEAILYDVKGHFISN